MSVASALRPRHPPLLLQDVQLGAVNVEQLLADRHDVAGRVDVELLDPAAELRRNHGLAALVELQGGEGAHGARKRALGHLLAAHAQPLHLVEAELHGAWTVARLVLADRDVVHVHGILLRHRRGVGRAHGIAVVFDLAAGQAWSALRVRQTPSHGDDGQEERRRRGRAATLQRTS